LKRDEGKPWGKIHRIVVEKGGVVEGGKVRQGVRGRRRTKGGNAFAIALGGKVFIPAGRERGVSGRETAISQEKTIR